ncbi:MAG: hypothetical protein HY423_15390 [Candidatus Lambdaproteobacteria bacterium]|nr:hypothetical protein [Candidatus Lambdaproteobacteria bacterium]
MSFITWMRHVVRVLWRYRDLVRIPVSKKIKVRFMGATPGFARTLLNPLILILVYLAGFTHVFRAVLPDFTLFLVTGIVHWTLFGNVVVQASELRVPDAPLIKKIRFP